MIPIAERWERLTIPEPNSGCLLWLGSTAHGYGKLKVGGRWFRAPRFAYAAAHGPIPPGLDVLHHCDTPACVEITHLWLGTDKDNHADRGRKGRQSKGVGRPDAKLTDAAVVEILSAPHKRGVQRRLAAKFGVSEGVISHVRLRKTWKHIPMPPVKDQ